MATVTHFLEARDSDGFRTGLTPSITAFKVADGTQVTPAPVVATEIGATGRWKFVITLSESLLICIDWGVGLASPDDRYASIVATTEDEKIVITETPSGTYDIILTPKTAQGDAIPGVFVAIVNQSGQTVRTCTTTANGAVDPAVALRLDAGTYTARSYKPMVNLPDVDFTVSGAVTVAVLGALVAPEQPDASLQTVYMVPASSDINAKLVATPILPEQEINGTILTGKKVVGEFVDGRIELPLIKGGQYLIRGQSESGVFYTKTITITDDGVRNLLDY